MLIRAFGSTMVYLAIGLGEVCLFSAWWHASQAPSWATLALMGSVLVTGGIFSRFMVTDWIASQERRTKE